jgi:hypothetical protein
VFDGFRNEPRQYVGDMNDLSTPIAEAFRRRTRPGTNEDGMTRAEVERWEQIHNLRPTGREEFIDGVFREIYLRRSNPMTGSVIPHARANLTAGRPISRVARRTRSAAARASDDPHEPEPPLGGFTGTTKGATPAFASSRSGRICRKEAVSGG